eukprot:5106213-Pyramimonas_sp.AAC.1
MWLLAIGWLPACVRCRDAAVVWGQPFPVDTALSGRQCHPHLRIALIYVDLVMALPQGRRFGFVVGGDRRVL